MIRPLAVAVAIMLSGCTSSNAQTGGGASLRTALPSLAPLVKRVVPSVVNIAVTENVRRRHPASAGLRGTPLEKQFRDRLRSRREQVQGAGSGFVIDPSGVIVTNNHVVGHADRIVVSLSDGTELPARVIGTDELTDIAVIKVDGAPSLPAVTWGDSRTVEVGDWILAAGNPFGLGSSVSAGIVSARGRDIGAGPFDDFLQIDAPINPGQFRRPDLQPGRPGRRGEHGDRLAHRRLGRHRLRHPQRDRPQDRGRAAGEGPYRPRLAGRRRAGRPSHARRRAVRTTGVIIASVDRSGPAAKAGLAAGDIVTAVNGGPSTRRTS